ncbi:alpha/beta hydrolase [Sinobaca sp. H24]|uniref:alpha/beta hydrolase n=1 Tax=Sinobaca sp. H24 TaxID=2923376 RepID=UPI00207969B0|nr:alpha/beta hydrolase [Sinobaca sp. H24]
MINTWQAKAIRKKASFKKRPSTINIQAVASAEKRLISTTGRLTPVTFYYPVTSGTAKLPIYINLHGGGFVHGDASQDDPYCRYIANEASCLVVNINYAKAPESPFPAALEESYEVIKWVVDHAESLGADKDRLAVGGQSAGGNLAAALTLLAAIRKEFSFSKQILNYPVLDLVTPAEEKPVLDENRVIPAKQMTFYNNCYVLDKESAKNPLASPIMAENMNGVPPALVITAEYDSLAEEAELYAAKLTKHGIEAEHRRFDGCEHAFTHDGPNRQAEEAWELIAGSLKTSLHTNEPASSSTTK